MSGFLFGYDTAVISGTVSQVTGQFMLIYQRCDLRIPVGDVSYQGKRAYRMETDAGTAGRSLEDIERFWLKKN